MSGDSVERLCLEYVERFIDVSKRGKLKEEVTDPHIEALADWIHKWEDDLVGPFELTQVEIRDIHDKCGNHPKRKRREVLHLWKNKMKLKPGVWPTYELLLKKCLEGGDTQTAEELCKLIQNCKLIALLSQEGRKDLQYQLKLHLKEILGYYDDYTSALQEILESRKIKVTDLSEYLSGLPSLQTSDKLALLPPSIREKLSKAITVGQIFLILKTECTSFLNYHIFERLIKKFRIEMEKDERLNYPQKLITYVKKHKISEFIESQPIFGECTDKKELVLVLDIDAMNELAQLIDIEQAVSEIMGLKPSVLLIHDIKEKCVIVTFLISTSVAEFIFTSDDIFNQKQRNRFCNLSVIQLECNGYTYLFDKNIPINIAGSMQQGVIASFPATTAAKSTPFNTTTITSSSSYGKSSVANWVGVASSSKATPISLSGASARGRESMSSPQLAFSTTDEQSRKQAREAISRLSEEQETAALLNRIDGDTLLEPNINNIHVMRMIGDLVPESVKILGQELGLGFTTMSKMSLSSIHSEMTHAWLLRYDNVPAMSGDPTWRSLARALAEMRSWKVVEEISKKYPSSSLASTPRGVAHSAAAEPQRKTRKLDHNANFTLRNILGALKDIVPPKDYATLAVNLELSMPAVRKIEHDNQNNIGHVLLDIIDLWMRDVTSPEPSWEVLEEAIGRL